RTPSNNGGSTTAYFKRTDGSDIHVLEGGSVGSYHEKEGTYFWAGEDHDGTFGAGNGLQTITWTGIDIAGKSNVNFKGLFAANNQNKPFENELGSHIPTMSGWNMKSMVALPKNSLNSGRKIRAALNAYFMKIRTLMES